MLRGLIQTQDHMVFSYAAVLSVWWLTARRCHSVTSGPWPQSLTSFVSILTWTGEPGATHMVLLPGDQLWRLFKAILNGVSELCC